MELLHNKSFIKAAILEQIQLMISLCQKRNIIYIKGSIYINKLNNVRQHGYDIIIKFNKCATHWAANPEALRKIWNLANQLIRRRHRLSVICLGVLWNIQFGCEPSHDMWRPTPELWEKCSRMKRKMGFGHYKVWMLVCGCFSI